MQKINAKLHTVQDAFGREAVHASGQGQYQLNSYAFYPKSILNSVQHLTGKAVSFNRRELLSVSEESDFMHLDEKLKRKRILVSADYNTAQRIKSIF